MLRACIGFALACVAAPAAAQTLEPARLPGMCVTIDAREGSVSRPCDKSAEQTFMLPSEAPGPIRYGEQCLAPRGGGYYPQLHPEACDGSPAQTWSISAEGHVRNGEGRCLALLGLSSRTGERVYGGECPTYNEPQQWRAVALDQEIYEPVRGRLRWGGDAALCLTFINAGSFIGLEPCGAVERLEQMFSFDRSDPGQFRAMSGCVGAGATGDSLRIGDCHVDRDRTWMLQDGSLLSNGHARCVEPRREDERWVARMTACAVRATQNWTFEAAE